MIIKKIRKTVALAVFLLFTVYLILDFDLKGIGERLTEIQFLPMLLKHGVLSISLLIFLVLTFVFGRFYCSTLCPMGIFQDILSKIGIKKIKILNLKVFAKIRYLIFIVSIGGFFFAYMEVMNMFAPYSNFAKIMVGVVRSVYVFGYKYISKILTNHDIYLEHINYPYLANGLRIFSVLIFLFLIVSLLFEKRVYCNYICPVGTFLSIFSRKSVFKISLDKGACVSCGLCAKACPADAIDYREKEIDYTRCVTCMNCLDSCNKDGISYNMEISKGESGRREFLGKSVNFGVSILGLFLLDNLKAFSKDRKGDKIIPPGAKSIENFSSKCVSCLLCVSKCPSNIIKAGKDSSGGGQQPYIDYTKGFCNFECNVCSQVCPSDAIAPISLKDKKRTQIGLADLNKNNCVVYKQGTACGACSEHCPTKAVYMIDLENGLRAPVVDTEYCIGCGACEHVCPVEGKAIKVKALDKQSQAKDPKEKKIETKEPEISFDDDFPF